VTIKPIRSEQDYDVALEVAAELIVRKDEKSRDDLEILQTLIERWEAVRWTMPAPTPIQAIRFRMDQLGLTAKDMKPYLGSKSRVSEILNGQRQLTIDQVRALNRHLRIPAESLIGEAKHEPPQKPSTASKAAIEKLRSLGMLTPREGIDAFLTRARSISPAMAMLRKSRTDRTNAKTDLGALEAWCAAVLLIAEGKTLPKRAKRAWDPETARRLAQLSRQSKGIALVEAELAKLGIILVVLDHLPGTFLDGAAICRGDGAPVIALTLRHDRLDNFWFTLLHEFAHVSCHLGDGTEIIVDDLEVSSSDVMEAEADAFAREALIPAKVWETVSSDLGTEELEAVAAKAGVHPAIVAGRWRWENQDYRRFSKFVGRGEVRRVLL
jgi:HTH-type transcriptional regulator / antitoxin HigA